MPNVIYLQLLSPMHVKTLVMGWSATTSSWPLRAEPCMYAVCRDQSFARVRTNQKPCQELSFMDSCKSGMVYHNTIPLLGVNSQVQRANNTSARVH